MLYFLYPQLRKLSGAERLILRLAAHTVELDAAVTLVTHFVDDTCRPALDLRVNLIETGRRARLFRNHYFDAPLEYLYSVNLLGRVGRDASALIFFGPPSLPALYWSKHVERRARPHLYFCYEPPRFIYDDAREITARLGMAGAVAGPAFSIYKIVDRTFTRSADVLLANSLFGAERLHAAYRRDATVITHGVDLARPTPAQIESLRMRYHLAGRSVLLTVNFLHPRKRIDLFLRTLQLVRAGVPNAAGLVVGAGPEAVRLHTLAHELQLDDAVIFTGFVPDQELPAYYALADLYLHTGKLESFGLSVLEASAAGVPVIAVNEGGPREIVADGESGRLVAADPEALAAAAGALLRDDARRIEMGAAGQRRVTEHYSWSRGAQTLLQVVQAAMTREHSEAARRREGDAVGQ